MENISLNDFTALLDWVLEAIPRFLMQSPIIWIIGLIFCAFIIKLFVRLFNL